MTKKKADLSDEVSNVCDALSTTDKAALGIALDALERLRKKAVRADKMAKILRGMFDDRVLDPYPTSDDSDEYKLRKLSGWRG